MINKFLIYYILNYNNIYILFLLYFLTIFLNTKLLLLHNVNKSVTINSETK